MLKGRCQPETISQPRSSPHNTHHRVEGAAVVIINLNTPLAGTSLAYSPSMASGMPSNHHQRAGEARACALYQRTAHTS